MLTTGGAAICCSIAHSHLWIEKVGVDRKLTGRLNPGNWSTAQFLGKFPDPGNARKKPIRNRPPASPDVDVFPENSGVFPPNHAWINRVFHYFHHPFWGTQMGFPQKPWHSAMDLFFSIIRKPGQECCLLRLWKECCPVEDWNGHSLIFVIGNSALIFRIVG